MIDLINTVIAKTNMAMVLVYVTLWVGFLWFLFSFINAFFSNRWPSVTGKVIKSKVVERDRIASGGHKTTLYDIDFEYCFVVEGKEYKSKRIRLFHVYGNSKKFSKFITTKYPIGADVTVFFKSSKPNKSVIQPGVSSGVFMFIVFFMVSLGSMSAVFYHKLF